jgi:hypothetical protein
MPHFYIEEVTKKLIKVKARDGIEAEEIYEQMGYVVAEEVHVEARAIEDIPS